MSLSPPGRKQTPEGKGKRVFRKIIVAFMYFWIFYMQYGKLVGRVWPLVHTEVFVGRWDNEAYTNQSQTEQFDFEYKHVINYTALPV